jgi:hypothetical protein
MWPKVVQTNLAFGDCLGSLGPLRKRDYGVAPLVWLACKQDAQAFAQAEPPQHHCFDHQCTLTNLVQVKNPDVCIPISENHEIQSIGDSDTIVLDSPFFGLQLFLLDDPRELLPWRPTDSPAFGHPQRKLTQHWRTHDITKENPRYHKAPGSMGRRPSESAGNNPPRGGNGHFSVWGTNDFTSARTS